MPSPTEPPDTGLADTGLADTGLAETGAPPPQAADVPDGGRRAATVLHRVFGYESFRGRQEEIIEHVIGGGDALVLMPTGGGKSLCYQIPALVRAGVGVVISPLIALMQDQVRRAAALGVRAGFLNSTQDPEERGTSWRQQFMAGELDLLYLAPERLRIELARSAARPRQDLGLRHRRGALRLPVGPRLPARLPGAVGAARALARRAADRADRDRDPGDAGRRSRSG